MSLRDKIGRRIATFEIAIVAAFVLPVVRVAAMRVPLPRLRSVLHAALAADGRPASIAARDVGRCVAAVGRRLPGIGTCLTHALVTEALLHRFRLPAEFVIGVERSSEFGFRAHAWVESAGTVVVGDAMDLDRFVPLASGSGIGLHRSPAPPTSVGKEVLR